MLPPHICLEKLEAAGINQKDIGLKVGTNQSSVSRIQHQLFKRPNWQTVERIQSLYKHVCLDKKLFDDFLDYTDFIQAQDQETA